MKEAHQETPLARIGDAPQHLTRHGIQGVLDRKSRGPGPSEPLEPPVGMFHEDTQPQRSLTNHKTPLQSPKVVNEIAIAPVPDSSTHAGKLITRAGRQPPRFRQPAAADLR